MKIRINNIGVRPPAYISNQQENAKHTLSIVQYYTNRYHGRLNEYLANGWEYVDDNTRISKLNCTISVSAFDNEESCMVIAYITYDTDECVTDLKSVGERILNLSGDDRKDFFEVYKIAANRMKEKFNEE